MINSANKNIFSTIASIVMCFEMCYCVLRLHSAPWWWSFFVPQTMHQDEASLLLASLKSRLFSLLVLELFLWCLSLRFLFYNEFVLFVLTVLKKRATSLCRIQWRWTGNPYSSNLKAGSLLNHNVSLSSTCVKYRIWNIFDRAGLSNERIVITFAVIVNRSDKGVMCNLTTTVYFP